MSTYRWNISQFASGYDAAAEHVHPHYREIQDEVLAAIPFASSESFLLVDLGGGSGKLVERALEKWTNARAIVLDQSEAFLGLAERRLARFEGRATTHLARLQEDWSGALPEPVGAFVSMSAIHHLDEDEKRAFARRVAAALRPGGVFINGDEVRPGDDSDYLARLEKWGAHMQAGLASGAIPPLLKDILLGWIDRNVTRFAEPRKSGDDCHDTAEHQLTFFADAGLKALPVAWRKWMWAVMVAEKPR